MTQRTFMRIGDKEPEKMSIKRFLLAVTMLAAALSFQQPAFGASAADDVLAGLASADWQERDKAIARVTGPLLRDPAIRSALIGLLEQENALYEKWYEDERAGKAPLPLKKRFGEGHGEYYLDLVAKVIALRDAKAINALVGSLDVGAPEKALAEFGDAAVAPALDAFDKTPNATRRAAVVRLMGRLSEKGISAADLRERAKAAVFHAADDDSSSVREAAIRNLHRFDKAQAVEKLRKIAGSDPKSVVHRGKNKRVYPLREAAQKELDRLSKTK